VRPNINAFDVLVCTQGSQPTIGNDTEDGVEFYSSVLGPIFIENSIYDKCKTIGKERERDERKEREDKSSTGSISFYNNRCY
jgi:hypothetical protein